jgi:protein O-GlcNAc transferase
MTQSSVNKIFALAVRHHQAGKIEDAIAAYRAVIDLKPDCVEAYCNMGMACWSAGRTDEAIAALNRAIELRPDFAGVHNNLGSALLSKGMLNESVSAFERAIQLKPDLAEAHINLATALIAQHRLDEAIASCRRGIALRPDIAEAYNNLGIAQKETGRLDEAIESFGRAVQIKPDYFEAHSNRLLAMMYSPSLSAETIFAEHRAWGDRHALRFGNSIATHANDRSPERRLRIGYVSADFCRHPVGYFILPLLENHDHSRFEIFCYSSVRGPDDVTERARRSCDVWRNALGTSDANLAKQISDDRIDILVDLVGHTSYGRLMVFARKPAPVQVTYLGYPNTTGMSAMDYRVTDSLADPVGMTDAINVEKLWRLDGCAWCYEPREGMPQIGKKTAGPVTFGSLNAHSKINQPLVELWAELLRAVPGSRMLVKSMSAGESSAQRGLREMFGRMEISADRVEMIGRIADARAHLEHYNRIDVALDTFPYHGTTTTCEALWMGVPVVSTAGKAHVSRVGLSLLTTVGLADLVAKDRTEYVRIATEWAGDPARRAEFARTIRERMSASRLMNAKAFAADMEKGYRAMWVGFATADGASGTGRMG